MNLAHNHLTQSGRINDLGKRSGLLLKSGNLVSDRVVGTPHSIKYRLRPGETSRPLSEKQEFGALTLV